MILLTVLSNFSQLLNGGIEKRKKNHHLTFLMRKRVLFFEMGIRHNTVIKKRVFMHNFLIFYCSPSASNNWIPLLEVKIVKHCEKGKKNYFHKRDRETTSLSYLTITIRSSHEKSFHAMMLICISMFFLCKFHHIQRHLFLSTFCMQVSETKMSPFSLLSSLN